MRNHPWVFSLVLTAIVILTEADATLFSKEDQVVGTGSGSMLMAPSRKSANTKQDGQIKLQNRLEKLEAMKKATQAKKLKISNTKTRVMIEQMVVRLIKQGDYDQLANFMDKANKYKMDKYLDVCLERFKSRLLCTSKTLPFYIWQRSAAENLWNQIVKPV